MQGVYCRYCRCLNKLSPKNFLADGGGDESAELSLASGNGGREGLPRRNSLDDLKIPARISQAQVGLRRDLGMVRLVMWNVSSLRLFFSF